LAVGATVGIAVGAVVGATVGATFGVTVSARVDRAVGGVTAVEPHAARPTAAIAVPMMVVSFMSAAFLYTDHRPGRCRILAALPLELMMGVIPTQREHVIDGYIRANASKVPLGDRSRSAVVWGSMPVVPPHLGMHPALILAPPVSFRLAAEIAATAAVQLAGDRAVPVTKEPPATERVAVELEGVRAAPHVESVLKEFLGLIER
jgi:hypothetical protein